MNGSVNHTYTFGHDLISQDQVDPVSNAWHATFYAYDGHGNVRFLTNESGQVTDTYVYDAFGTMITAVGTTNNRYLYTGEQFDPTLGLYYLRARLMNPLTGRFWSMDSYEGDNEEPASFHKYTYASVDPTNASDPSGMATLVEVQQSSEISAKQDKEQSTAGLRWFRRGLTNKAWTVFVGGYAMPRFHTFIYVEKIGSAGGLRYDIGLTRASQARFGRSGPVGKGFDVFDGLLTIQPALRGQVISETGGRLYPVAAFTNGQFAFWNALVVPLGYGVVDPFSKVDLPLPYAKAPYPFTFSCFKWTLEAAVAAYPIQILPF